MNSYTDVVIYVVSDNEAPSITVDNFTVAENANTGAVLATATAWILKGLALVTFYQAQAVIISK